MFEKTVSHSLLFYPDTKSDRKQFPKFNSCESIQTRVLLNSRITILTNYTTFYVEHKIMLDILKEIFFNLYIQMYKDFNILKPVLLEVPMKQKIMFLRL